MTSSQTQVLVRMILTSILCIGFLSYTPSIFQLQCIRTLVPAMPDTETREKVGRWELGFLQELGPFRGCTAEKGWDFTRGCMGSREGVRFYREYIGEQGKAYRWICKAGEKA